MSRRFYLDGISETSAEKLLTSDLHRAQLSLERRIDDAGRLGVAEISDSQYDALVSFIFNIGTGNFSNSTLLTKLQERAEIGGDAAVAEQFRRWKKSGGAVVQGLVNRREREVAHFFAGFDIPVPGRAALAGEAGAIDIRIGEEP